MKNKYEFAGRHLFVDLLHCRSSALDDENEMLKLLRKCVKAVGATSLRELSYKFEPQGVSVFILLAESHATLSLYPEHSSAFFDFFACGTTLDPYKALDVIVSELNPKEIYVNLWARGNKAKCLLNEYEERL